VPDGPGWRVEFAPRAARVVARYGRESADFNPTIAELIAELERDPKQFPTKGEKLKGVRAAALRYRGSAWRMPFTLDEDARVVTILVIGPHNEAYRDAAR
jgi:mRNA-degrading endonuclease RelE of RelBE toxin-antitoxin system